MVILKIRYYVSTELKDLPAFQPHESIMRGKLRRVSSEIQNF